MVFWPFVFEILTVFWSFFNFGSILAQRLDSFICKKSYFLTPPGTPGGTSIVEWTVFQSIRPLWAQLGSFGSLGFLGSMETWGLWGPWGLWVMWRLLKLLGIWWLHIRTATLKSHYFFSFQSKRTWGAQLWRGGGRRRRGEHVYSL